MQSCHAFADLPELMRSSAKAVQNVAAKLVKNRMLFMASYGGLVPQTSELVNARVLLTCIAILPRKLCADMSRFLHTVAVQHVLVSCKAFHDWTKISRTHIGQCAGVIGHRALQALVASQLQGGQVGHVHGHLEDVSQVSLQAMHVLACYMSRCKSQHNQSSIWSSASLCGQHGP